MFATVLFAIFAKHCVSKCSVNTACSNTVFDLQISKRSHFDEGSFAVFVSRYILKCSGCLMGQYIHLRFKLQLLNTVLSDKLAGFAVDPYFW